MGKYELKTKETEVGVDDFLDAVPDEGRREDAKKVRAMMERISGYPARMWGPSIVGFGRYSYASGQRASGEMARIGFSPRAKELVLYLVDDFARHQALMGRLGKHKTGKCCLYVKRLTDLDENVLEELIRESLAYTRDNIPKAPDGALTGVKAARRWSSSPRRSPARRGGRRSTSWSAWDHQSRPGPGCAYAR